MNITYDDNYGADIDGNRGITVIDDIELDEDDTELVQEQIREDYCGEEYNDSLYISLDVENSTFGFDVIISEYFTEAEFTELQEESKEYLTS